jgi:hypothetical protein
MSARRLRYLSASQVSHTLQAEMLVVPKAYGLGTALSTIGGVGVVDQDLLGARRRSIATALGKYQLPHYERP